MNSPRAALRRIRLIAAMTVVEAMRQRFALLVTVLALGALAAVPVLRDFNFGASEIRFLSGFGFGVLGLLGSILAIVATAQLFFGEIEHRTVHTLLAKPVRRTEFICGKFLGVLVLVTTFSAVFSGLLIVLLSWRHATLLDELEEAAAIGAAAFAGSELVLVALAQWLKFAVLSALTLLIASYARSHLFAVMTSFALLLVCHLQPVAAEVSERSGSLWVKLTAGGAALIFPNFQLFDLSGSIDNGGVAATLVARIAGYALLYTAAALGLASYSFRCREL